MKTVEFIITAEIIDEDFSDKEINKILTELEDVINRTTTNCFIVSGLKAIYNQPINGDHHDHRKDQSITKAASFGKGNLM